MKIKYAPLAAGFIFVLGAANSLASDGTIKFIGEITDQACEIDAPEKTLNIDLGVYSVDQFRATVGTPTPDIPVDINLINCPVVEEGDPPHFSIYLTGASDTVKKEYLQIPAGSNNATGVAIVIKDDQGNIVPMNAFTQRKFEVTGAKMTLNLTAHYESTNILVTPGLANATTDITFNYR